MILRIIGFVLGIAILLGVASAATLTVGQHASNDYVTDGTDDAVQINQAITAASAGDIILLNGSYFEIADCSATYRIDIDKNVKLKGLGIDSTEIVTNVNADPAYIGGTIRVGSSGGYVILEDFTINGKEGSRTNQTGYVGNGYDNGIVVYPNHIVIENVGIKLTLNDGINLRGNPSDNITVQNCVFTDTAHADIYAVYGWSNCTVVYNIFNTRSNAAVRWFGNSVYNNISNNYMAANKGGGDFGIEAMCSNHIFRHNRINNNTIMDIPQSGIAIRYASTTNKSENNTVNNNYIAWIGYTSNTAGVYPDGDSGAISLLNVGGTVMDGNTFFNNKYNHISFSRMFDYNWQSGYNQSYTIKNSIFLGAGRYAINKSLAPSTVWVYSDYNDFYNNSDGNCNGAITNGSGNIYVDPLFNYLHYRGFLGDNINYSTDTGKNTADMRWQLNSTAGRYNFTSSSWNTDSTDSPCIDVGDPISDYSNEPDGNGNRINMGMYGNTIYASKTTAGSSSMDTTLKESYPDTNFVNQVIIDTGGYGTNSYTSIIFINVSGYNITDTIDNATLQVFWSSNDSGRNQSTNISIYEVNGTVVFSEVDWNNKSDGNSWTNAGGDWWDANNVSQGLTPYDNITFPNTAPTNQYYNFDVTTLVQAWVNGSRMNNGFFIVSVPENINFMSFSSFSNATVGHRPLLPIEHSLFADNVSFILPTLSNDSTTSNDYVEINASIESTNLTSMVWNWNGQNTTFLNDSCVLHMSFDNRSAIGENETVVVDVSQYGNNGAFINGSIGNWTTDGYHGEAMLLDGINDNVSINADESLNISTPFTVSLRAKRGGNSSDTYGTLIDKCSGYANRNYNIYWTDDGQVGFRVRDVTNGVDRYASLNGYTDINEWISITGSYDGTNITIYIDDSSSIPTTVIGTVATDATDLKIGRMGYDNANGFHFNGTIDELRVDIYAKSNNEHNQSCLSNFYKYNSSQWYFESNQTDLDTGEYNYQIFVNSIESDYRVVTVDFGNYSQDMYIGSWMYVTHLNSDNTNLSNFYSDLSPYYIAGLNSTDQMTYGYMSTRWTKYADKIITPGDAAMLRYTANVSKSRDNATGTFSLTLKSGLNHIGHSYNGTRNLTWYNTTIASTNLTTIQFQYPTNGTVVTYTYGSSANGTVEVPQGVGVEVNVTADTVISGL